MGDKMPYNSLFDKLSKGDVYPFNEPNGYCGPLTTVFSELDESLASDQKSVLSLMRSILHPPRIIRAAIDYKMEAPESEHLVKDATELGLAVYAGTPDARQRLANYKTLAGDFPEIMNKTIIQEKDRTTWGASDPGRSKETARLLADLNQGDKVLFIALAHGGVSPGMDVYLRYCDLTKQSNSVFYPVRFSRRKTHDSCPVVSHSEKRYLQEQASGRKVVLFDEDSATGQTLSAARNHFFNHILPGTYLRIATNYDFNNFDKPTVSFGLAPLKNWHEDVYMGSF